MSNSSETSSSLIKIDEGLMDSLSVKAKSSDRKRSNYNLHGSPEDSVQRFLNAVEPGSYIPPHKHTDSIESFVILRGKIAYFKFDDDGSLVETVLSSKNENPVVEIPRNTIHSLAALEEGTVVYIVMEGPYRPEGHKTFPEWAHAEGTQEGQDFLKSLTGNLGDKK